MGRVSTTESRTLHCGSWAIRITSGRMCCSAASVPSVSTTGASVANTLRLISIVSSPKKTPISGKISEIVESGSAKDACQYRGAPSCRGNGGWARIDESSDSHGSDEKSRKVMALRVQLSLVSMTYVNLPSSPWFSKWAKAGEGEGCCGHCRCCNWAMYCVHPRPRWMSGNEESNLGRGPGRCCRCSQRHAP